MNKVKHSLPGTITAITAQKKRRNRYSVFVDDEFLIGVDDDVLLKNNLHKGVEMTSALFEKLQRDEGRQKIKSYLLKLLSQRDHSRGELRTKAGRKDFNPDVINHVLNELEEKGYIDDKKFAQKYAHDKNHLSNWGPLKIKVSLLKKGIDKHKAEKAVSETFDKAELGEQFKKLIKKREQHFKREEDPLKRKKKVADYLQRKGYYGSDVFQHLDSLMAMFESSEEERENRPN